MTVPQFFTDESDCVVQIVEIVGGDGSKKGLVIGVYCIECTYSYISSVIPFTETSVLGQLPWLVTSPQHHQHGLAIPTYCTPGSV